MLRYSNFDDSKSHRDSATTRYLPLTTALAVVAFLWGVLELAARLADQLWGDPSVSVGIGHEPFVLLAVSAGAAVTALRLRHRAQNAQKERPQHRTVGLGRQRRGTPRHAKDGGKTGHRGADGAQEPGASSLPPVGTGTTRA